MRLLFLFLLGCVVLACNNVNDGTAESANKDDKGLSKLFDNYWQERMKLFPLEATQNGDYRYNDRMSISFTDSFRDTLRQFYTNYLNQITRVDTQGIAKNDRI